MTREKWGGGRRGNRAGFCGSRELLDYSARMKLFVLTLLVILTKQLFGK